MLVNDENIWRFGLAARLALSGVVVSLIWIGLTTFVWQVIKRLRGATEKRIETVGTCLIVSTILVCLAVTVVLPSIAQDRETFGMLTRWIHLCGVMLLGEFLLTALYLQIESVVKKRRSSTIASVRKTYAQWLWITEIMPAPAAIMLFFTGFNRLFAVPGYSINSTWIFALVGILGVMMADGIFGYTPAIRNLAKAANSAADAASFYQPSRDFWRDLKLLVHSVSFPLVALLPIWKVGPHWSPATPVLRFFEVDDSGSGWHRVLPGLCLFGLLFAATAASNQRRHKARVHTVVSHAESKRVKNGTQKAN
jgi:hypothetical protein